ncbi:hypothetical protein P7H71_12005 [Lactococcus lactis]|uniref:MacB-like periplasmic core domain-containing protein n=1 Tax=Lactococcus lactis TaxID=1358 RepID=A0AAP5PDJ6_9LACT|nr:hypothetical protein [Lactococcus lactis]MDT2860541.1 hypothetical protein [Lactococcus lactis]MDT2863329.1 hypothetical protein [Lactococcus lactis]MDT2868705.1 hypothetical protein [Lactococcus lactis]MDT2871555.1 hypothetical protein [Lactococcus lactis]MDT2874208.1 hypothetical protein [Lactococcus lactis]
MRELIFDFKRNGFLIFSKIFLFTLFSIICFICFSFGKSTNESISSNFSRDQDKSIYTLIDSLYQPEEFSKFRSSESSVETVGKFYSFLNQSNKFNFLSVFDQPLYVSNFKGAEKFSEGQDYIDPQNKKFSNIKSVQLNEKAYKFYNLKLDDGVGIDWKNINLAQGIDVEIPVILGSDYAKTYKIGDTIEGEYYFKSFNFKVSGFLQKNSSIFYKESNNFFLDDYILIPYPEEIKSVNKNNKEFLGILYFAMINGNIAVDKNISTDNLITELDKIGNKSNFYQYSLIQVPGYLIQFKLMRELLISNLSIIISITLLMAIGLLFLLFIINKRNFKNRAIRLKILWEKGEQKEVIERRLLYNLIEEYLIIYVFFIIFYFFFSNHEFELLQIILIVQTLYFLVEVLITKLWLNNLFDGGNLD